MIRICSKTAHLNSFSILIRTRHTNSKEKKKLIKASAAAAVEVTAEEVLK
jgi:hypothetical protein